MPGYKLHWGCKVRTRIAPQEEAPPAMQPPYLCVSPSAVGSEVRTICFSWRDELKGEAHVFIAIVVMCLLLLVCCVHVELIAVLTYSYLFTVLLCCFKNSFWLRSFWCCLGQLCPFLMSSDALPGLRTEMWHGRQLL